MSQTYSTYRIITFAGMPGSGKSCAARELAAQLSCKWVDLDAEVERRAGKSIARIFAEDGETAFRALEKSTLHSLISASDAEKTVLSLGGGTLQDPENLALVRDHTYCIWLNTPLDVIAERLWVQGDIGERPLLAAAKTKKELEELLKSIFTSRKASYTAAAKEIKR